MRLINNFFFIVVILLLSMNNLKAEDKVAYLDIDYILTNTLAEKSLLKSIKQNEEIKISKFKSSDENFKNDEMKILAKKNLISNKELKILKKKRNTNIINFINLINPIIEKYMADNSIYILMDKKNIFIANNNYDITKKLIELIDNQIKTIKIE